MSFILTIIHDGWPQDISTNACGMLACLIKKSHRHAACHLKLVADLATHIGRVVIGRVERLLKKADESCCIVHHEIGGDGLLGRTILTNCGTSTWVVCRVFLRPHRPSSHRSSPTSCSARSRNVTNGGYVTARRPRHAAPAMGLQRRWEPGAPTERPDALSSFRSAPADGTPVQA